MKDKKGFTLVELLAVIAILAILATVATPLVMTAAKRSKQKMYDAKVKMIEEAAVMCAQKEGSTSENCKSVNGLCTGNYLAKEDGADKCQKNPVDGKEMNCEIELSFAYGRYTATMYKTGDGCQRE